MKAIDLENVAKRYGSGPDAVDAVADVTLGIQPGELFFLLGPSGCGKTTLLRIIAGLVKPDHGTVRLGERDVTAAPPEKRRTAMVFQNYALWPHMTVNQNVEFPARMQGVGRQERRELARKNLLMVEMTQMGRRKPNQLSGGQQQRVALARALAARAECLLLDEPLSNLDARLRIMMRGELRHLIKASGTTGVYVTHDQEEALSMADRIAVMDAGAIVQVGAPQELYDRPATRFVASFLGEANFLDGEVVEVGDVTAVQTPAGLLRAATPGGPALSVGDTVTCCVRPENVRLGGQKPADEMTSVLPARIDSQTYLGDIRQYVCSVTDDVSWRTAVMGRTAPPEGEAVHLHVSAGDVCLLTE